MEGTSVDRLAASLTLEEIRAIQRAKRAEGSAAPALRAEDRPAAIPLSFGQERLLFLEAREPGSVLYNVPVVLRLHGG